MFKKFAFLLVMMGAFAVPSLAETYKIPVDSDGRIPADINLVGADVIDATSTVTTGFTSPVILLGVVVSSDAATNYATLRDTDTLNTSSNVKMVLYPNNTGGTSLASGSQVLTLPAPVIFRNGISINLNAAPPAGGQSRWHFIIRRRTIGNTAGREASFADTAN